MRRAAIASVALLAIILGAGCLKTPSKRAELPIDGASSLQNLPFQQFATSAVQDVPAEAPKDLDVPGEQPDVKSGETASASQNMIVSSIVQRQMLANPFVILGRSRSLDNKISWRVRDARGKIIADGTALTNAPKAGAFGRFRARSFYDRLPETETGTVEVFTVSPANGAEQDLVSIPVTLETRIVPVKVFFSNIKEDLQTVDCARVHAATRRVPLTEDLAEAAIVELLKGPSVAEQSIGYRTSIFPGTSLRSITVKDGTVTVDFSKELLYAVSGSCHIQALGAQIEQTLKQFASVTNVKRLIDGQEASETVRQ